MPCSSGIAVTLSHSSQVMASGAFQLWQEAKPGRLAHVWPCCMPESVCSPRRPASGRLQGEAARQAMECSTSTLQVSFGRLNGRTGLDRDRFRGTIPLFVSHFASTAPCVPTDTGTKLPPANHLIATCRMPAAGRPPSVGQCHDFARFLQPDVNIAFPCKA